MYNIIRSKNNMTKIVKKALIGILVGAFLFNDIAYAVDYQNLAPKLRMTLPQFKESFKLGYILLSHEVVNNYIRSQIEEAGGIERLASRPDTINGKTDIRIVSIRDLFVKTGQLAHVGLGKHQGMPIIYIDSKFLYDEEKLKAAKEEILQHEFDEISQYEVVRESLEQEAGRRIDLREEWLKRHLDIAVKFHNRSYDITRLYNQYAHLFTESDWLNLYELYNLRGLNEEDKRDFNIAAGSKSYDGEKPARFDDADGGILNNTPQESKTPAIGASSITTVILNGHENLNAQELRNAVAGMSKGGCYFWATIPGDKLDIMVREGNEMNAAKEFGGSISEGRAISGTINLDHTISILAIPIALYKKHTDPEAKDAVSDIVRVARFLIENGFSSYVRINESPARMLRELSEDISGKERESMPEFSTIGDIAALPDDPFVIIRPSSNIPEKYAPKGSLTKLPKQFLIKDDNARQLLEAVFDIMPPQIAQKISASVKKFEYPEIKARTGSGLCSPDNVITIGPCLDPLYFIEIALHEIGHAVENEPFRFTRGLKAVVLRLWRNFKHEDSMPHKYTNGFLLYILYPSEFRSMCKKPWAAEWSEIYERYKTLFSGKEFTDEEAQGIHRLIKEIREKEIEKVKASSNKTTVEILLKGMEEHRGGYLAGADSELFANEES